MNENPLVLQNGLPITTPLSGSSAFVGYASSQITTDSSSINSATFTTFDNSPAFTFTPTITGTYKIYCSIPTINSGTSVQSITRIFNTSGSATLLQESQTDNGGISNEINTSYAQSNYTLTAGISYQFDIQGKVVTGSGTNVIASGSNSPFYMFAEGIGLAQPTNGFDSFASTQITTNTTTGITSGSFTTFDNSPGFSITPNFNGNYKVYCSIPIYAGSTGATEAVTRIFATSGSPTLQQESFGFLNGTSSAGLPGNSAFSQSVYTLVAGSTYVFDIQGKQTAGSGGVFADGSDCPFYIFAERIG